MELSISIVETTVNLGKPVTVRYSVSGARNSYISADCLFNSINLGSEAQSGTIKLLPVMDGTFNVSITGGFGEVDSNGGYSRQETKTVSIHVN